jgi:hypothetical protein
MEVLMPVRNRKSGMIHIYCTHMAYRPTLCHRDTHLHDWVHLDRCYTITDDMVCSKCRARLGAITNMFGYTMVGELT